MIRDSRFRSLNHVRRAAANAMKSLPLSAALRTWPDLLLARHRDDAARARRRRHDAAGGLEGLESQGVQSDLSAAARRAKAESVPILRANDLVCPGRGFGGEPPGLDTKSRKQPHAK